MKKYLFFSVGLLLHMQPSFSQNWSKIPYIGGDGVTELGKYIDFHEISDGQEDYMLRLTSVFGNLCSTGGIGINTASLGNSKFHIFGSSGNTTNLVMSANYENSYRWKFKTIDRGHAIDFDIVGTNSGDEEETLLKLSPSFSGRPELSFMNDWLIVNNGNVGIGTTTPAEKLSVNGKIRAHEIKVETANWPDYVFNQDYKILGLQELDAYIKLNKHLPDMPSAKEAEVNGVELGKMNKLLLKKVEELTLHLIRQEKRIKNLEKTKLKKSLNSKTKK